MTTIKTGERNDKHDHLAALINNMSAVRAVVSAVSGTLGPQGLDCMLVDQGGKVMVTNDGVTILKHMNASHPAAKMIINIAKAQDDEVGDGTTTATVIAGTLLEEAVTFAMKGVPIIRIIEGLRWGQTESLRILAENTIPLNDLADPRLKEIAVVAARGNAELARLVVDAAVKVGREKLMEPGFKLSDCILALEGLESKVYQGVIIGKQPVHRQMPKEKRHTKVLIVDDALEPEKIEDEALSTEIGFTHYLKTRADFLEKLSAILDEGVGVVLVDRGISPHAEQLFLDRGVIAVQRVAHHELIRAADLCGCVAVKKAVLAKPLPELNKYFGNVERVTVDEENQLVGLENEKSNLITIIAGASTTEVVEEKERMLIDAASAAQAAVKGGIVPGGGAMEMLIAKKLNERLSSLPGLAVYGARCLIEALKRPLAQIAVNASLNPLEKIERIWNGSQNNLGLDCRTGDIVDMTAIGVVDPSLVKRHAICSACEVAEAILRINTVIMMKPFELHSKEE